MEVALSLIPLSFVREQHWKKCRKGEISVGMTGKETEQVKVYLKGELLVYLK